jgi:hypothetical protein
MHEMSLLCVICSKYVKLQKLCREKTTQNVFFSLLEDGRLAATITLYRLSEKAVL